MTDATGEPVKLVIPPTAVVDGETITWPEVGAKKLTFRSADRKFSGTFSVEVVAEPTLEPTPEPSPEPTPEPSPAPSAEPSPAPSAEPAPTSTANVASPVLPRAERRDLYTLPGYHYDGGRRWFTSCEPYSATVRCRTEIWATTVRDGKRVDGWTFNSLTYRESPRALWAGNPLATRGEHEIAGRKWRTECDTALTGRGGCRSYIWRATGSLVDGQVRWSEGWHLNNIVRFS